MNAPKIASPQRLRKNEFQHNEEKDVTQGEEHLTEEALDSVSQTHEDLSLHNISPRITDVFQALGNYDVRFDFDPFSVDDCRCNIVSSREVGVLCSLKHVPLHSLVIEEGSLPGGVKLKVKDDFVQRYDEVSWEDFLESTSEGDYLDPTKVREHLLNAVLYAVGEVNAEIANASVAVLKSSTVISLWFPISEDEYYKVNLFPSIRANSSCENYHSLLKTFSGLPTTLSEECRVEQGIHVVARPAAVDAKSEEETTFWSITFNDIERRVVLSEKFECARDCLLYLNENLKIQHRGKHLSTYQLQAVLLREIFMKPNSKAWKRKCLQKRLVGILKSLNDCLQKGRCPHVFTGVNLFAGMKQGVLQDISSRIKSIDIKT